MSALTRELAAVAVLAIAFVFFSLVVASGAMSVPDHGVYRAFIDAWRPQLETPSIGVAFLGGLDLTILLVVALGVFLWHRGFRDEVLALLAFPAAEVLEYVYKRVITHPQPPASLAHGDAPSVVGLFEGSTDGSSFPSGHVTRATLVYGLLAFTVWRLAGPGWVRRLAIPIATLVVIVEAIDRLYLGVHWESDVLGALLLGGTCLAGAIVWLDRPRSTVA